MTLKHGTMAVLELPVLSVWLVDPGDCTIQANKRLVLVRGMALEWLLTQRTASGLKASRSRLNEADKLESNFVRDLQAMPAALSACRYMSARLTSVMLIRCGDQYRSLWNTVINASVMLLDSQTQFVVAELEYGRMTVPRSPNCITA